MAYNAAILSKARANIARRHEENLAEQERRTRSVYAREPRVRAIDAALRRQMAELCALTFNREPDARDKITALREKNMAMQRERAGILRRYGLGEDYLDELYSCPICHDTGYNGAGMCECLRREYKAELTRTLSGLLRDNGETFADFDAGYYSAERSPELGASPREVMGPGIRDLPGLRGELLPGLAEPHIPWRSGSRQDLPLRLHSPRGGRQGLLRGLRERADGARGI